MRRVPSFLIDALLTLAPRICVPKCHCWAAGTDKTCFSLQSNGGHQSKYTGHLQEMTRAYFVTKCEPHDMCVCLHACLCASVCVRIMIDDLIWSFKAHTSTSCITTVTPNIGQIILHKFQRGTTRICALHLQEQKSLWQNTH